MDTRWETAVQQGDVQAVRDELARGVDVNAPDHHGQTALMLAAHAGNLQLVEVLIAQRASLNTTAKYGLSALMLAVVAGHEDVALLLADAGAEFSLRGTGAPGFAGKTARDLAVERGMHRLPARLTARP